MMLKKYIRYVEQGTKETWNDAQIKLGRKSYLLHC